VREATEEGVTECGGESQNCASTHGGTHGKTHTERKRERVCVCVCVCVCVRERERERRSEIEKFTAVARA